MVETPLALNDPSDIAGAMCANDRRCRACSGRIENGADGVHRLDHAVRRFLWQIAETLGYLRAGTLGEFLEQRLSRGSHADDLAAAVGGVGFRGDQAVGPETLEDAAEIG